MVVTRYPNSNPRTAPISFVSWGLVLLAVAELFVQCKAIVANGQTTAYTRKPPPQKKDRQSLRP